METGAEKECSALGGLFQAIISDLKVGMPMWEDFLMKAGKLHSQMKSTILTTTSFLDAFQKVADLATNTRGCTKDIGTALTRICLRQKAVEARMKTFTSALMECLVTPLQEKMEEWKKTVANMDKDHAKEYKRARQEIKKRSLDTIRLQKKVRKGKCDIQRSLDSALIGVNEKYMYLEETEKQAVRTALIEERSRFCLFVACLKPVVDEEVAMLGEITHLQEIMEQLSVFTADPFTLPAIGEQLINEIKGSESTWAFQTPPSSPSSIGSRKSSMCSISSINSSSSGSTKSHSPSHHLRYRTHSQQPGVVNTLRLCSLSSQDSGFTSQDTLYVRPHTPPPLELLRQMSSTSEQIGTNASSSTGSTPSSPCLMAQATTATWPNIAESVQLDKSGTVLMADRPHTISSTYERGHQRPPLTVHTFEPLDASVQRHACSMPSSPQTFQDGSSSFAPRLGLTARTNLEPEIPLRNADRPKVPEKCSLLRKAKSVSQYSPNLRMAVLPNFNQPAPNQIVPQPVYVNINDLSESGNLQPVVHAELSAAIAKGICMQKRKASVPELSSTGIYGTLSSTNGFNCDTSSSETLARHGELMTTGGCVEDASKYCTMPRYGADHLQFRAQYNHAQRPSSTAGLPNMGILGMNTRTGSLRRTSSQTNKPPPPIRRTSSITSQHAMTIVALRCGNSTFEEHCEIPSTPTNAEDLNRTLTPMTPLADTLQEVAPLDEDMGNDDRCLATPENGSVADRIMLIQGSNVRLSNHQDPPPIPSKAPVPIPSTKPVPTANPGVLSVAAAAAAKALEKQKRQQPLVVQKPEPSSNGHSSQSPSPHSQGGAFFQDLNAKLQQHVQKNSGQLVPDSPVATVPVVEATTSSRQSFKEALNAKLAQQHGFQLPPPVQLLTPQNSPPTVRKVVAGVTSSVEDGGVTGGVNVNYWLAHRLPYDPVTCRESLLDQIKRGTTLRKTLSNDRSAPKIQ